MLSHNPSAEGLPREVYLRRYKDPLTGHEFQSAAVRSGYINLVKRMEDFRPVYRGYSPLWYSVVVAPSGFAAEDSQYERSEASLMRDRPALVEYLSEGHAREGMRGLRDIAAACASYELALGCTPFLKLKTSEIGSLAMKASWLYKEWAEGVDGGAPYAPAQEHVDILRRIALDRFLDAYENEDLSHTKAGYAGTGYLIAQILFEQGELDEAARWFGRIVRDKSASAEVLRMARNQMDLCQEERHKRG